MAAEWCDHFEGYPSVASMLQGAYAQVDTGWAISATNPRTGAKCMRNNGSISSSVAYMRRTFKSGRTLAGIGMGLFVPQLPTAESGFDFLTAMKPCIFLAPGGNGQVMFILGTDGAIVAYSGFNFPGGGGATYLGRSDPAVIAGAYNQLEFKVGIEADTGFLEARVNNESVLNLDNINTDPQGAGTTSQVAWSGCSGLSGSFNSDYDDLHAWNGEAGEGPTDFVGNVGVIRRRFIQDTAEADFVISSGTDGYAVLDDSDDATYISTPTVGARSGFLAEAFPDGTTGIVYQQVNYRARKSDLGDCNITPGFKQPAGSEYTAGDEVALSEGNSWKWGIVAKDPATAAPWDIAGAESAAATFERTL